MSFRNQGTQVRDNTNKAAKNAIKIANLERIYQSQKLGFIRPQLITSEKRKQGIVNIFTKLPGKENTYDLAMDNTP